MRRILLGVAVVSLLWGGLGMGAVAGVGEAPSDLLAQAEKESCATTEADLPSMEQVAADLAALDLGLEPVTAPDGVTAYPAVAPAGFIDDIDINDDTLGGCSGALRPGVRAVFNNAWICSLNWVFQDKFGAYYIGTAGHCIDACNGNNPLAVPSLAIAVTGVASDIGDPVYSTGNCGVGNDFALIKIDPAYYSKVDPTMCHWGGAQGVHTTGGTQLLLHYGWGVVWAIVEPTRHRAAVLDGSTWNQNSFTFAGAIYGGDSGSPIMVWDPLSGEGKAVGVITHTSLYVGPNYATRLDTHVAKANSFTGLDFQMLTSTTLVSPIGDGL